jgi:hypothetical protein
MAMAHLPLRYVDLWKWRLTGPSISRPDGSFVAEDAIQFSANRGDQMDLKSTLNPLSVAATLGCIMTSAHPVRADVIVIPELQAATLFGASAANNNSSSGPGIFVGSDGAGNPKRGLIEFNIAGSLPSDATITSASLSLVLGQVAGSGG